MFSDDPPGSLSDVLEARRALAAALKAPLWSQSLTLVGGAAAIAAVTGGGLTAAGLAAAVVIMLATVYLPIVVVVRGRRALGVQLRRHRRTRRRLLFAWLVFVVLVALWLTRQYLRSGTFVRFGLACFLLNLYWPVKAIVSSCRTRVPGRMPLA